MPEGHLHQCTAFFRGFHTKRWVTILLIVVLAAIPRFLKLAEWSFWTDEVYSVTDSLSQSFLDLFSDLYHYHNLIPYILIKATLNALGTDEWTARLPFCLIGIISVPILYLVVEKIFEPKVALVASMMLAVSPWHIYWSQNARYPALWLLFSFLALATFYSGLEDNKLSLMAMALVFLFLAFYSHAGTIFLTPVFIAYPILLHWGPFERPSGLNKRNLLIAALVSGLVAMPFLLLRLFKWSLRAMSVSAPGIGKGALWTLSGVVYYIGISTICLAVFSAIFLLLRRSRAGLLFTLSGSLPLLLLLLFSELQSRHANRYAFIILPSILILAAYGAVELITRLPNKTKILGIGVLALLIAEPLSQDYLYYTYQRGNREDWRAGVQFVQGNRRPDDLVMATMPRVAGYYLGEEVAWLGSLKPSQAGEHKQRIWFIEDNRIKHIDPQIQEWVEENAKLVADFDVPTSVYIYKMKVYLYDPSAGG